MIVKPCAEFRADFPDDHIEEDGEIVRFGGLNVAEAIADILVGFGCTVEGIAGDFRGWWCGFRFEGLALIFQLVDLGDHYVFVCEEPLRARPDYDLFLHALLNIDSRLKADSRFHDLLWYSYANRPGESPSESPVTGELPPISKIKKKRGLLGRLLAPMMARPQID